MRLVVDTNVFVSAALKENPYRSSLPAESISMTRPASALHRSGNDLSLHEDLARMLAAAELWRRPTSAILTPIIGLDPDEKMARIPAPNHAIARTHPVLWRHGGPSRRRASCRGWPVSTTAHIKRCATGTGSRQNST
jgi:hypothetical protein